MAERLILLPRRTVLKGLAAGAATAIARPAFAVPDTIKIGLVGPRQDRSHSSMRKCLTLSSISKERQEVPFQSTAPSIR